MRRRVCTRERGERWPAQVKDGHVRGHARVRPTPAGAGGNVPTHASGPAPRPDERQNPE
jgi:hypothetical protein